MPETVNLYLSDAQAAEVRALAAKRGVTIQRVIRELIHEAARLNEGAEVTV